MSSSLPACAVLSELWNWDGVKAIADYAGLLPVKRKWYLPPKVLNANAHILHQFGNLHRCHILCDEEDWSGSFPEPSQQHLLSLPSLSQWSRTTEIDLCGHLSLPTTTATDIITISSITTIVY